MFKKWSIKISVTIWFSNFYLNTRYLNFLTISFSTVLEYHKNNNIYLHFLSFKRHWWCIFTSQSALHDSCYECFYTKFSFVWGREKLLNYIYFMNELYLCTYMSVYFSGWLPIYMFEHCNIGRVCREICVSDLYPRIVYRFSYFECFNIHTIIWNKVKQSKTRNV